MCDSSKVQLTGREKYKDMSIDEMMDAGATPTEIMNAMGADADAHDFLGAFFDLCHIRGVKFTETDLLEVLGDMTGTSPLSVLADYVRCGHLLSPVMEKCAEVCNWTVGAARSQHLGSEE